MRGIAEGKKWSSRKFEKEQVYSPSKPHHCVKTCLIKKKENPKINGVIVRRNKALFDCWCFSYKGNDVEINYDRDYQSCVLILKGRIFNHFLDHLQTFLWPHNCIDPWGVIQINEYND